MKILVIFLSYCTKDFFYATLVAWEFQTVHLLDDFPVTAIIITFL